MKKIICVIALLGLFAFSPQKKVNALEELKPVYPGTFAIYCSDGSGHTVFCWDEKDMRDWVAILC